MVAKDIFPFATITDSWKKINFMEYFNKIHIFYPLQPWLIVAKDIFFFATMTGGCEEANFMEFSHYIYENELTSRKHVFNYEFGKKEPFSFLILQSRFPDS